jgi:Glycosyltransferases involved in cell wall biogenesis
MRFSIAIPAYKSQYLKQCIHSILNQTTPDLELIIVNDDSPFDIDSIVTQIHDPRIRYFKNDKNCGAENVVDNWNICLSYAQGEYFVLMGDDDEMLPDYLETFEKLILLYPNLNVYHCRSFIINEKSEKISLTPSWPEWESVYENIWHRMNGVRSQYISDFVYRTEHLRKQSGFHKQPLAWASDDITSFKAATKYGIAHTQNPVFCYRQTELTLSSSGSTQQKMKAIEEEEAWYNNFLSIARPITDIDNFLYNCIKTKRAHYFISKRIETIAYSGIRKGNYLNDFFYWLKNRQKYKINIQHLAYAFILAIKKHRANRTV